MPVDVPCILSTVASELGMSPILVLGRDVAGKVPIAGPDPEGCWFRDDFFLLGWAILVRFLVLITLDFKFLGRERPCSLWKSAQALQSVCPSEPRRQRLVCWVLQLLQCMGGWTTKTGAELDFDLGCLMVLLSLSESSSKSCILLASS